MSLIVIVDSSVWIDYFRGTETLQTFWLEQELKHRRLGLTDLILCEVLQGIRDDASFDRVGSILRAFDVLTCGGEAVALAAAENYRLLRSKGITVRKTIDCLIATFCIAEGHSLLHRDGDFEHFERFLGLQVIHPRSHWVCLGLHLTRLPAHLIQHEHRFHCASRTYQAASCPAQRRPGPCQF